MSPSLRHHLILQHAPAVTQLPLWRSATWTHANNRCFPNVFFGIADGSDDGQSACEGAGDAGRAMVVAVIVLMTVMGNVRS